MKGLILFLTVFAIFGGVGFAQTDSHSTINKFDVHYSETDPMLVADPISKGRLHCVLALKKITDHKLVHITIINASNNTLAYQMSYNILSGDVTPQSLVFIFKKIGEQLIIDSSEDIPLMPFGFTVTTENADGAVSEQYFAVF